MWVLRQRTHPPWVESPTPSALYTKMRAAAEPPRDFCYYSLMPDKAILEWEGREYDHNPKSTDWYWALGIIAVAGTIASVLFSIYLLAVLIIIAAGVFSLHAAKEPPIHRFRLVEQGIIIGDELHHFERMLSFSVLEDVKGELPPMLSIKTESWL